MFSSQYRSKGSFKQRFYQSIAGCIGLTLFLSPLEIPLSELAYAPVVETPSAVAVYQAAKGTDSPKEISGPIVTYTRGDEPVFFNQTSYAPEPSPNLALAPEATTTAQPELVAVALTEPNERLETKSSKLSSRAMYNHLAAQAVASGDSGSELTAVSLDAEGNIVATADIHGNTKSAEYNEAGQPVKITEGDGTVSYYSYDDAGHLLGVSRKTELAKATGLKGLAQRIFEPLLAIADSNDEDSNYSYDANDIALAKNASGAVEYEYDEDGLVTLETRLDGSQVEYEYDELGNVVSAIEVPANSNNELSLSSFLRFSYAESPLLATVREFSNYDDSSRLKSYQIALVTEDPTIAAPIEEVTDTADLVSGTATSTVRSVEMPTMTPATSTDSQPTVPTEQSPEAVPSVTEDVSASESVPVSTPADQAPSDPALETITSTITAFLGKTTRTIALWFDDSIQHSFADEVDTATTNETPVPAIATTTTLYAINFTYDAQGNVTSSETNTGIKTTYTYDQTTDSLLATALTTATGEIYGDNYSSDASGRLVNQNGIGYTYTDSGMLAQAGNESYTYDKYGNRTNVGGLKNAIYQYEGNRLLGVTYSDGQTTTNQYDERGAVTSQNDSVNGNTNYTYNAAGAIASIARGSLSLSYEYDALNRRTSRTSNIDGTVYYHYNSNSLKRVTDTAGNTIREYFYTPRGILIAIKSGDTYYHVNTSYNRSVTGLVDTTTGALHTVSYDAWGQVVSNNLPINLDIGYIGAFFEPVLQVSILGPRVYDPTIGRFLSKDPLSGVEVDTLSQNEYIYAKNDPINQYDPSGHASELATGSASPKRSLAETEVAIELLEDSLRAAEASLADIDQTDIAAYTAGLSEVSNTKSALNDLYTIRTETIATIAENEAEAQGLLKAEASSTEPNTPVFGFATSSSTSVSAAEIVSTSTISIDISSTADQLVTTTDSATPTPESDTISDPVSPIVEEVPNLSPTIQDTPPTSGTMSETTSSGVETVSLQITDSLLVLAAAVFGDHLLKAEAKKKSKVKKSKKSKTKVTGKAKSKQKEKARKLAAKKQQLRALESKLAAIKAAERAKGPSQTELANMASQLQAAQVTLNQIAADKQKATEAAARAQAAATAARNLAATTDKQVAALATAPAKPITSDVQFGINTGTTAAGIYQPQTTFGSTPLHTSGYSNIEIVHNALTICGFEPSLVGLVCGVADGVIYLFEGEALGASLSFTSAMPLFIGTASDSAKAGLRIIAATKNSLLQARSIPELLTYTNKYKVLKASSNTVHVLHGTADDAKAVFDAQTMGWVKTTRKVQYNGTEKELLTATSPDSVYTLTFRDFSTEAAVGPFTKINGTIDVQEFTVFSNNITRPKGDLIEIKFAE